MGFDEKADSMKDKVTGKIKEGLGKVSGDSQTEAEARTTAQGKVKEGAEKLKTLPVMSPVSGAPKDTKRLTPYISFKNRNGSAPAQTWVLLSTSARLGSHLPVCETYRAPWLISKNSPLERPIRPP